MASEVDRVVVRAVFQMLALRVEPADQVGKREVELGPVGSKRRVGGGELVAVRRIGRAERRAERLTEAEVPATKRGRRRARGDTSGPDREAAPGVGWLGLKSQIHCQAADLSCLASAGPSRRAIGLAGERQEVEEEARTASSVSLASICGQLLTLLCALLALLYLADLVQRQMTNLLTRILGGGGPLPVGERRRSSASRGSVPQDSGPSSPQTSRGIGVAQSQSSSTLNLPRNSICAGSSPAGGPQRRSSRSSLHSLLAALTGGSSPAAGGQASSSTGANNNYNSRSNNNNNGNQAAQ